MEEFHNKYSNAGCDCNDGQSFFFQSKYDGYDQSGSGTGPPVGSVEDGRNGHGCQYCIRNVCQKRTDEPVIDFIFDRDEWYHTNQISGSGKNQQIKKEYTIIHRKPPKVRQALRLQPGTGLLQ